MDTWKPTVEEREILDIIKAHILKEYRKASFEFEKKPEGDNWDRLKKMMWVRQGVSRGGLMERTLVDIASKVPFPKLIDAIYLQHKGPEE